MHRFTTEVRINHVELAHRQIKYWTIRVMELLTENPRSEYDALSRRITIQVAKNDIRRLKRIVNDR